MAIKNLTISYSPGGFTFHLNGNVLSINRKTLLRHLFGYDDVTLIIPFNNPRLAPLRVLALTWFLARGQAFVRCPDEKRFTVTLPKLIGVFILHIVHPSYSGVILKRLYRQLHDILKRPFFLREIRHEVRELLRSAETRREYNPVDFSNPVIYLRAILAYNIRAGGSVSHIAGVLNNLEKFTAPPVFITSDSIPTVHNDIQTITVQPSDTFSHISELRDMYFSRTLEKEVLAVLKDTNPAFIYQRESLFNYTGVKLSRHLQIPLVLEFNGSEIWVCNNWGTPLKYETIAREIELLSLKAADLIVVVSHALEDSLVERGIDKKRILVNPNGVDTDRYSPGIDGSEIRKKYKLGDKTVIGFIGTFGHWHGAEILAEAFGRLLRHFPDCRDNLRLLMIGDGLKMPEVKKSLTEFNAADYCTLTGLVPQEEGPKYLAACDILVSPHRPNPDGTPFFGSPTKLFEYMSMGKGIVASNLDQIGDVLDHNKTAWLVEPGDPAALSDGLKTMIDDTDLRKKLGAAARREVVAHHTWKEHTGRIIEKVNEMFS